LERRGELSACDVIDVWASPIIEALEIDLVRGIRWLKVTTKISGRDSARLWGTGADWRAVLERAFPDAPEGDRMLGWSLASLPFLSCSPERRSETRPTTSRPERSTWPRRATSSSTDSSRWLGLGSVDALPFGRRPSALVGDDGLPQVA